MTKNELNAFYRSKEFKAVAIAGRFESIGLPYDVGFYNGHFFKNDSGEYEKEFYPIYVISVEGVCDVEIEFDAVSVSAKLRKDKALSFDYNVVKGLNFSVYGVNDYLKEYHVNGNAVDLIENIRKSSETEIGFQFIFTDAVDSKEIAEFVKLLQSYGFYC